MEVSSGQVGLSGNRCIAIVFHLLGGTRRLALGSIDCDDGPHRSIFGCVHRNAIVGFSVRLEGGVDAYGGQ